MKIFGKIILIILLSVGIFYSNDIFAEDGNNADEITVPIGTDLSSIFTGDNGDAITCNKATDENGANCVVKSGFGGVQALIGAFVKYFTFIATLGAVLFVVINGVQYSMSGLDQAMKDKAKEKIIKTMSGIILLLLSGTILNILFPWIYK